MFALELQRRSDAAGWGVTSNAAHPGYARTDLMANGPGANSLLWQINRLLRPYISHSAADGRAANPVCGDLAGREGRWLLWPELVLRVEGTAGTGEDHAAGQRRRGGGTALGYLRRPDRCVVRAVRGRRLNVQRDDLGGNRMKVILFGATGMVGQGVLRECLLDPGIESVLAVGRSPTGQRHAKLREIIHDNFTDFSAIEVAVDGLRRLLLLSRRLLGRHE